MSAKPPLIWFSVDVVKSGGEVCKQKLEQWSYYDERSFFVLCKQSSLNHSKSRTCVCPNYLLAQVTRCKVNASNELISSPFYSLITTSAPVPLLVLLLLLSFPPSTACQYCRLAQLLILHSATLARVHFKYFSTTVGHSLARFQ